MTRFRVDAAEVAELGVALAQTGAQLELLGDPGADRWALGPGDTGPAVEELLAGWRRARLALAQTLGELGRATVGAGGGYLEAEAEAERTVAGVPGERGHVR